MQTLEERRNRQDLIELFKIFQGLSRIRIDELFVLDENMKGTRGHCLKLRKTRYTRNITRHFFRIGWSTDGTCWISGQSMHLALVYLGLGKTGWASSGPLSPRPRWGWSRLEAARGKSQVNHIVRSQAESPVYI